MSPWQRKYGIYCEDHLVPMQIHQHGRNLLGGHHVSLPVPHLLLMNHIQHPFSRDPPVPRDLHVSMLDLEPFAQISNSFVHHSSLLFQAHWQIDGLASGQELYVVNFVMMLMVMLLQLLLIPQPLRQLVRFASAE